MADRSTTFAERSCSKGGARKRETFEGLRVCVAGSADGTVLLVMPPGARELVPQGAATAATNERFYAVADQLEELGVHAIRVTAMVMQGNVITYYIEFDADAWSALGL